MYGKMASGDGIDTIEIESVFSNRIVGNSSSTNKTMSDDDDKDKTSIADGRATSNEIGNDQIMRSGGGASVGRYKYDRERKLGHRRIGEGGQITYKKIETTQLMGSIQLGIQHTVGSLASKPKRDLLMMDFWELETISFPPEGSSLTPAHHYSEFRFKIYAPIAFRYFRDLFGIQPDDFMMSMCSAPLRELSNPGASGSIFYLTDDDEFIIKTVQHKEGEFLQKLLPGYYMNLNQNPRTLLPKFFGLYCFQCNSKNIRLIVMNNLLPSYVRMHLKYDLKGSTYKRKANKTERNKKSPTYKDLDFMEQHPNGIFLEADTYNALVKTIQRDCRVLESFKIMDYSLLVGVHNLDLAFKEKQAERMNPQTQIPQPPHSPRDDESDLEDAPEADQFIAHERDREERERGAAAIALNRSRSINRQRLVAHSTAMESIQAESEPIDEEEDVPPGGIPARSEKGERLLLFIGIIDILQSYRLKKKLEHTFKSIIHDGNTVSVCRPSFYAQRFQDFMAKTVFKKIPSPLKHSPSKRKSLSRVAQRSTEADSDSHPIAGTSHHNHHHHVASTTSSKPATPTTAAPLSMMASSTKPIITTAPSQSPALSLPPLKQKTGIIKSKVPPPVPPRGSPKDRRMKKPDTSPKGTPSSGSYNYLNDKYFACASRRRSVAKMPVFGERRSPSCVEDWLAINDFGVPNVDEIKHATNICSTKICSIKTNTLQREHSFSNSSIDVRSIIDRFSGKIPIQNSQRNNICKDIDYDLSKSNSIPSVRAEIAKLNEKKRLSNDQLSARQTSQNRLSFAQQQQQQTASVLSTLKPVKRKKRLAPRAEDIYRNSQEKHQIIQAMSTVEIRSSDDNYDLVIENFSLDGEFV